jgi:Uma2 family endonuclease
MANGAARKAEAMNVEGFLAFLDARQREEHWELHDGVPRLMVGGSIRHGVLASNILRAVFDPARARGCRAVVSVLTRMDEFSAFEPDVMVRCGDVRDRERATDDPCIVFEVLSPSTMHRDRGFKFDRYQAVTSLEQIVFVYQDSYRVESWLRRDTNWAEKPIVLTRLDDSLALPVIGASLAMTEIYLDVTPSPLD